MILFKGKDKQSIELQILNYEFPEISKGPDANWLEVYLKIKLQDTIRRIVGFMEPMLAFYMLIIVKPTFYYPHFIF
jgi:hypothetical protein